MNKFVISILFDIGFCQILFNLFKILSTKTIKAFNNLSRQQNRKTKSLDPWLKYLSVSFSKVIKLNDYKRIKIASDLQTANISIIPELYIACAIVKAMLVGVLIIPALIIFPLISPLIIALAVMIYFKETKGVEDI